MDEEVIYWGCFGVAMVGALTWQGVSLGVESWLRKNDPRFRPPSFLARMFVGRLFIAFPQMKSYKRLREERGESTTLVTVFWVGFIATIVGLIAFFVSLAAML